MAIKLSCGETEIASRLCPGIPQFELPDRKQPIDGEPISHFSVERAAEIIVSRPQAGFDRTSQSKSQCCKLKSELSFKCQMSRSGQNTIPVLAEFTNLLRPG